VLGEADLFKLTTSFYPSRSWRLELNSCPQVEAWYKQAPVHGSFLLLFLKQIL
jgi:hypothetical protein